jgi:hypothetical protein
MKKLLCFLCFFYSFTAISYENNSLCKEKFLFNPTGQIQLENDCKVYFSADFLFWQSSMGGLAYVQTGTHPGDDSALVHRTKGIVFDGEVKKINSFWSPAVRLKLGYKPKRDNLDLDFIWTRFSGTNSNQTNGFSLPIWGRSGPNDTDLSGVIATHDAKAKYRLRLNLWEFAIGKPIWVQKYFSVKPLFAAQVLSLDQNLRVNYKYLTVAGTFSIHDATRAASNFFGGGVKAGSDIGYKLSRSWNIFGRGFISLLYGEFDCKLDKTEDNSVYVDVKDKFRHSIPLFQSELGLSWEKYFYSGRYFLRIKAGWEENLLFGINQMNRFAQRYSQGELFKEHNNLFLHGLTFDCRFDF